MHDVYTFTVEFWVREDILDGLRAADFRPLFAAEITPPTLPSTSVSAAARERVINCRPREGGIHFFAADDKRTRGSRFPISRSYKAKSGSFFRTRLFADQGNTL